MLRAASTLRRRVAALPSQCEVCRAWGAGRVCARCVQRFAQPAPRCSRCALRLGQAAAACGECQRDPPPFSAAVCAVDYSFPWNQLMGAFKFQGQVELATALAARMEQALALADDSVCRPDCLLPVPLSAARLAARGYNQAWELTRRLAAARGLPARADVLLRPVDTAQQAELDRAARQRNLRAAFMVAPTLRPWLAGRRLALVDDVMTTGATLREAAATLLRAGAADVQVWVVARTPEPGTEA
jgi:ComF family protein